ncbi:MAG: transcription termination/antitermination protein NusG [Gemmatimonadetes bacterium]|nr:transcription termination/antitermination protein NusG [Gemmatimonadota bacterium]
MNHRFYAIQTTSGHENKVRMLIQRRIDADTAPADQRQIRQALVPTEQVVEIKNGKKVTVDRKVFPGYVLVEMDVDQETLHTVNSIQGVIKFVGKDREPQPLRPEEVNRLLGVVETTVEEEPKEEIPFLIGQAVAITEGPFTDFNGTIEEVMADKGKVRVSVSLFGRPTSVELDYLQLRGH